MLLILNQVIRFRLNMEGILLKAFNLEMIKLLQEMLCTVLLSQVRITQKERRRRDTSGNKNLSAEI